jgi:L-glyceraldehyde 3-phosphate reductase
MAIAWLLKDTRITSVIIGVSSVLQLQDNLQCLHRLSFDEAQLLEIEQVLG